MTSTTTGFDFYAPLDEQVEQDRRAAAALLEQMRDTLAAHLREVLPRIAAECEAGNLELAAASAAYVAGVLAGHAATAKRLQATASGQTATDPRAGLDA